jgi:hypothetical protein
VARQAEPKEVQITLADGSVLDFQVALGDQIVLNRVDTYIESIPPKSVLYYTLQVTPGPSSQSTEG